MNETILRWLGALGVANSKINNINNNISNLWNYIYNMPIIMAAADVVICRAGAMTLSEIAAMKKAAVVIPSPNVTDNHQYKNAKALADAGAAVLLEESAISGGDSASARLTELYEKPELCKDMCEKVKAFASDDVEKVIYVLLFGHFRTGTYVLRPDPILFI